MKKKLLCVTLIICVLAVSFAVFAACNKDDKNETEPTNISQYFVSTSSAKNYTSAEWQITLPENVEIQNRSLTSDSSTTSSQNYPKYRTNRTSYVDGYDGFVLTNKEYASGSSTINAGKYHGFYKIGDDKVTIPVRYEKICFAYGLIAVMDTSGAVGVFDASGNALIECGDAAFDIVGTVSAASESYKLNTYISILSPDYIATKYKDSQDDQASVSTSYLRVFNVHNKKQVASFYGIAASDIEVFGDNFVLSRKVNSKTSATISRFDSTGAKKLNLDDVPASGKGYFETLTDGSSDKLVVTYLGNDKFFIYADTSGTKEDCTYLDADLTTYKKCMQFKYSSVTGNREFYGGNKYFVSLTNSHYAETMELDINGFLKPQYTYASYVIVGQGAENTSFDQMILDEDMNVLVSSVGNLGTTLTLEQSLEGMTDITLRYVDGYGISVNVMGALSLYDEYGKKLLYKLGDYTGARISDGNLIVETTTFASSSSTNGTVKYGILDLEGNERLPIEYDYISDFCGGYALATKYSNKTDASTYTYTVIDRLGNRLSSSEYISNSIAVTTAGNPLYMNGVFSRKITQTEEDDSITTWYDLANFKPTGEEAAIFDGKFHRITVVNSDSSLATDIDRDYPNRLFAFAQSQSAGTWAIYVLK